MSLSVKAQKKRIEVLFGGYIRQIEKLVLSNDQRVPKGINAICLEYYSFNVRMNVYHRDNSEHVQQKGKVVQLLNRDPRPFGFNMGYNKGIHEWTVQLVDVSEIKRVSGSIGITTELNDCKRNIGSPSRKGCAMLKDCSGRVFTYGNKGHGAMTDRTMGFGKGDRITVVLDCDVWKFRVKINDKPVDSLNIEKDYTYYFTMIPCNNAHFVTIDF